MPCLSMVGRKHGHALFMGQREAKLSGIDAEEAILVDGQTIRLNIFADPDFGEGLQDLATHEAPLKTTGCSSVASNTVFCLGDEQEPHLYKNMDVGLHEGGIMTQDEPMFTVHKSHLNTGLRGVPVGTCRTSFVTPTKGIHSLRYPDYDAHHSSEDIVYLLFNKELPTPAQSTQFKADLAGRGHVPETVAAVFHTLPKDGHPMDWLSVGIHTLGMLDTTGDWKEDALNLIARMPRMMGLLFRIRDGRGENIPEDDLNASMVQRFVRTLAFEDIDHALMEQILATYLVLHMDHGGGNLSTFTRKAIASGHATVYSSIAGAMNALSGPSRPCQSVMFGIRSSHWNQRPR